MKNRIFWKCNECGSETNFKGLCRECTEYDDNGLVVKPVAREKYNGDGSKWTPPKQGNRMPSMDLLINMKNSRRRKPTKKQMRQFQEDIKNNAEFKGEINEDGDFMDLGESVEEE